MNVVARARGQLAELGTPKLEVIGGKDCDGVTKTPGHGDTFQLGAITVRGVHTPCHTQDSICYFMADDKDKAVFTGDTLFIGGKSAPCASPSYAALVG